VWGVEGGFGVCGILIDGHDRICVGEEKSRRGEYWKEENECSARDGRLVVGVWTEVRT